MTRCSFKIINLDCVIGRRGITIQLPPSILAKLIILKLHHAMVFYCLKHKEDNP
jgi:hypothetical protein